MNDTQNAPSLSQAQRLKKLAQEGHFSYDVAFAVMEKRKRTSWTQWSSKTTPCGSTFPRSYTPKQMEDTIIKLLEQWQQQTAEAERTLTYADERKTRWVFFFCKQMENAYENYTTLLSAPRKSPLIVRICAASGGRNRAAKSILLPLPRIWS